MTIEERIEACQTLHRNTTDPRTCLAYWYELQGLLVAAGQVEPPPEIIAGFVVDYERGLEEGRALVQLASGPGGAACNLSTSMGT